ncbi:hypothetical protein AAFC00_005064 [Neodothiora populina]|uniref:Uncharacterized protein n=1 Tax=Neodothiora populina TaxID=2781224 RepID=A0ABR3PK20_9PEZI
MTHSTHASHHAPLGIEELWNLTAANLLVLHDHSSLFTSTDDPASSPPQQPWMRMAMIKNPSAANGYQAILVERGRLVCETGICSTPYEAAIAMLDHTSVEVGQALMHSRAGLREGRPQHETVLRLRREPSRDGAMTVDSVCTASTVEVRHKPFGQSRGCFLVGEESDGYSIRG